MSKGLGALGPKGLKPNYYTALYCVVYIKDGEMHRLSAFIRSLHSVFYLWPLLQKAYMPTVLNEVYYTLSGRIAVVKDSIYEMGALDFTVSDGKIVDYAL